MDMDKISEIRTRIDAINQDMLKLFLERMSLMKGLAEQKIANGLPILDRARERAILAAMTAQAEAVGDEAGQETQDLREYTWCFFQKMMALGRAREYEFVTKPGEVLAQVRKAMKSSPEIFPKTGNVACQGVEGSNAQAACDKMLPQGNIIYVKSFEAVFDAVGSGLCKFGVVPIENSANGSVKAVYNLMRERRFWIVRSTNMHIRHELLVTPGTKFSDIKQIHSHPQALGQCSKFLASLPGVEAIPCANTAVAAKMIADTKDKTLAAIAAPQCAELYGLVPLRDDIQDSDNNYTRFICITKDPLIYTGSNHISLIITCPNEPGALNDILAALSAHGINMNKLESYPIVGRDFEFMFFIELEASVQDHGVLPLLEELERTCPMFAFLGSYAIV